MAAAIFVIVGLCIAFEAILLKSLFAVFAFLAGIYHASHSCKIIDLEFFYMVACFYHSSNYFVAGNHWKDTGEPVILDLVQVGVTNATKQYFYLNVVRSNIPALKCPWSEIGDGAFVPRMLLRGS